MSNPKRPRDAKLIVRSPQAQTNPQGRPQSAKPRKKALTPDPLPYALESLQPLAGFGGPVAARMAGARGVAL